MIRLLVTMLMMIVVGCEAKPPEPLGPFDTASDVGTELIRRSCERLKGSDGISERTREICAAVERAQSSLGTY